MAWRQPEWLKIITHKVPKNTAPPPRVSMSRQEYLCEAWGALIKLARSGRRFSSDDIVARTSQINHQRQDLGVVVREAKRRGLVRVVGMVQSARPESRLRLIRELIGTKKAEQAAAVKPPAAKSARLKAR